MSLPEPISGFPPISGPNAKVLILGSMPSEESLRMQQYYAHPRNGFWPIMMNLLGQPADLDYTQRAQVLIKHRIALWDTLQTCVRGGSLDSAIVDDSIEINDFESFYRRHPGINHVFFNGRKSEQVYCKRVLPKLTERYRQLPRHSLPSTSPAMASLTREQKLCAWSKVLDTLHADD